MKSNILKFISPILLTSEKDLQIQNQTLISQRQEIQTENAISEIKAQIEADSKKLYEEMKEQVNISHFKTFQNSKFKLFCINKKMSKVENDLSKSKSLREKQAKESQKQIEKLKSYHEKQVKFLVYICNI